MNIAHGEQVSILEEEHGHESGALNAWGMMFFLASESLIFANFIAAYLYLEIMNLPKMGAWLLDNPWMPLLFTFVLLSSSGTMHLSGLAMRKGNIRTYATWLGLTIILGIIFLSGQSMEYTNLVHQNFTVSSSVFGSSFFTLTGFHGLHVTIGVLFMLIVFIRGLRGDFTRSNHFAATAAEWYWHFVDGVWVVVFTLIYSPTIVHTFVK